MSDLQERLADLSPAKRALLEKLLVEKSNQQAKEAAIPRRPDNAPAELSRAEQRLWFVDRLERDHPFYNMPLAAKLTGELDREALVSAVQQVVRRHESLRTTYDLVEGRPQRRIHADWNVPVTFRDFREHDDFECALKSDMRTVARETFDLTSGPLIRVVLYQASDSEHIVLLVMHHIVSDGWSMIVMMRELTEYYSALVDKRSPDLPELAIQYADFVHWQNQQLTEQHLESQLAYWRQQLQGAPEVLDLPTDFARPVVQDFDGSTVDLRLSRELTSRVNEMARREGTTPFVVLLAAQALVLGRYANQEDLILGTASAGREHPGIEGLIGFFVSTLAIRVRLEDLSFSDLVRQVASTVLDAHQHADIPFEKLVDEFASGRDRSYSPIFQAALVLQNLDRDQDVAEGLSVQPMTVDNGTAKYDLTFFLWEEADQLIGHVEYRTKLFELSTVNRLGESFQTLLDSATKQPDVSIHHLPILSAAERVRVLEEFNDTTVPGADDGTLAQLFAEQASALPGQIAVVHNTDSVTYRELDQLSNCVAAGLIAEGVQRESAVLVQLPRGIPLIASVLGIVKSGGSFVLLDHEAPAERIEYLREATNARLMIDASVYRSLQESSPAAELPAISPSDRAYIVFTSGSTGEPKGVEVEHRSITNFIYGQAERMGVTCQDRTSFTFSPAFDGGISEIFYPLSCGATMVVVGNQIMRDPASLTRHFNEQGITVTKLPPALLAMLSEFDFPLVRTLVSAGDKLKGELASRWIDGGRRFFNGYGPSEVAVGCTMRELCRQDVNRPPIGTPMRNMRVYVLDRNRQPLPVGAKGEIYVGGMGVARGYLNRPDLTERAFVLDPFVDNYPNSRMYRTGDLGRWLPDGNLEFCGRVDNQVSLRGFRIEPGEIAAALEKLPEIRQAEVVVRNEGDAGQLVAYLIPQSGGSDDLNEDAAALETDHVQGWKSLFQQAHRAAPAVVDAKFNIAGWVSTYDGQPIPADEMLDWTESTVTRILDLNPSRVLEIGCGTGLLLLRLIDHVQSYVGTDLLKGSLDNVQKALQGRRDIAGKVRLHQLVADDFGPLGDEKFDTIILNSVVQYFPSTDYLQRVIEGAMKHLAPGGKIFLGDLRNYRLGSALATSIELHHADSNVGTAKLREQVLSRLEHEEELLVDPQLFGEWLGRMPRLADLRIELKNARMVNELSRFRFDAILQADVKAVDRVDREVEFDDSLSPSRISERFDLNELDHGIRILGVPNARVMGSQLASQRLFGDDEVSLAELSRLDRDFDCGFDPNDYFALPVRPDANVQVTWNDVHPGKMDVVIAFDSQNIQDHDSAESLLGNENRVERSGNDPLSSRRAQRLTSRLREQLRDVLPSYMIPSAMVLMDEFPRTVNGKIDRSALPVPVGRPAWAGEFVDPATETEKMVARVWEDLLDVRPIGLTDDFFELGGHSMLAVRMISTLADEVGHQLPLQALFQDPTVRHLSRLIDQPERAAERSIVPLCKANAGQPLFCIHPAGGTVFCYRELISKMTERPVYGLQARGIDGQQDPHDSLVEMAEHYADLICNQQPTGVVHVLGWSLGGNIAFEVARQLQIRGRDVGTVALLDSGLLSPDQELREEDFLPLLMALFPGAMNIPLDELRTKDRQEQLQFFIDRATVAGIVPDEGIDKAGNIFGVFQANVKAVHQYVANQYDGDVHLFRPADQSKTNNLFDDAELGWRDVCNRVQIVQVPGDHAHMLQEPAVETLARELDQVLRQHESRLPNDELR